MGFSSEPGLYGVEALGTYSMLHLGEVGFAWCLVTVAADLSEAGVSSQPLHQVFDVGDLL